MASIFYWNVQMLKLEPIDIPGYETVVKISDPSVALKGFIAVHDTTLGPSLGGIRMYPYAKEEDALADVLRLAKGMTQKAAIAKCETGGGKSVIIGDPHTQKTEALFRSFGRAVEAVKGKYICAEDVGISPDDLEVIRDETKYVVGLQHEHSSGNPAPYTAWGTLRGIQAALEYLDGSQSLEGITVAVQGLGAVGMNLVKMLYWQGARLLVADVRKERVERAMIAFGAEPVDVNEIPFVRCDVLAPCALGGVVSPQTIDLLKCRAIAGCANNQLTDPALALLLKQRGIAYAPDFVINAGGLINVVVEMRKEGYSPYVARQRVDNIYKQVKSIFEIADQNNESTHDAANALASYRLEYGIGKRTEEPEFHHMEMSL